MSEALSTASLKKLFKFPFEDPQWQSRFLVGAALILANYVVPIVPTIFVSGYALRIMRQALDGRELALPAWDDWGKLALDGLYVTLVSLVYLLPALIVFVGGMVLYFVSPMFLPLVAGADATPEEFLVALPLIMMGGMVVMFLAIFLGTVLSVLGGIAVPVATAHFVAEDDLRAAFRLRQWWRVLTADKLGYFISWVIVAGLVGVLYVVSMLAYSTVVLCCLMPFLVAPISLYISLVGAGLFGQTYRESAACLPQSGQEVEDLVPAA
jgi:hypothetical protein